MFLYQGDKNSGGNDSGDTRSDDAEQEPGANKKPHANVSKRNSNNSTNKYSPRLEEIQEENKRGGRKKSSPTFEIPPSLDSGIVTRSVSSHSPSNCDDDYNDHSDDDDDDEGSDGDSEFLSKDDLKMFGNKAAKIVPDDNDIVSDIYSTAFFKVPKVRSKTNTIRSSKSNL